MPLPTWERTHYEPGGGDALLHLAVYSELREPMEVSEKKHRTAGVPSGIQVGKFMRGDAHGVFASFLEQHPGLAEDSLEPDVLARVRNARGVAVLKGTIADP